MLNSNVTPNQPNDPSALWKTLKSKVSEVVKLSTDVLDSMYEAAETFEPLRDETILALRVAVFSLMEDASKLEQASNTSFSSISEFKFLRDMQNALHSYSGSYSVASLNQDNDIGKGANDSARQLAENLIKPICLLLWGSHQQSEADYLDRQLLNNNLITNLNTEYFGRVTLFLEGSTSHADKTLLETGELIQDPNGLTAGDWPVGYFDMEGIFELKDLALPEKELTKLPIDLDITEKEREILEIIESLVQSVHSEDPHAWVHLGNGYELQLAQQTVYFFQKYTQETNESSPLIERYQERIDEAKEKYLKERHEPLIPIIRNLLDYDRVDQIPHNRIKKLDKEFDSFFAADFDTINDRVTRESYRTNYALWHQRLGYYHDNDTQKGGGLSFIEKKLLRILATSERSSAPSIKYLRHLKSFFEDHVSTAEGYKQQLIWQSKLY